MSTYRKISALLGAGMLVFAMTGTALAATPASDQGVTPTTVLNQNIQLPGSEGNPDQIDFADCDVDDALLTGNASGQGTTTNGVTVEWTYDGTTKAFSFEASGGLVTIAYVKGGNDYNEYDYATDLGHGVSDDGNMFAPDNGSEGPAGLSHAIFCTEDVEETAAPSPSLELEDITEAPTDAFGTNGTSSPADGAWLLVVALGVLLGSVVVLTPARAKSRR